jgi:alpha-beta hydrolase superfamily lysophospholipase
MLTGSMNEQHLSYEAPDALRIHVYCWSKANAKPKAVLQIAHGMAEHAGRYRRLAELFVAEGWVVYAHDHRGHGRSIPENGRPGHMADDASWTRAVGDLYAINRMAHAAHPGLPIVLMGHSMGSFMSQQLVLDHPEAVSALVLSGSNGKPPPIATLGRLVTRLERLRVGYRDVSPILSKLSFDDFNKAFAPNRTTADWLSRDPDEVDKYVDDPLCGFPVSVQTWLDMLDALPALTEPSRLARLPKDLPIYLFSGSEDPVGDRGAGVRRLHGSYRAAGMRDTRCTIYPGARHETLNETNREQVMSDLLEWCERALQTVTRAAA